MLRQKQWKVPFRSKLVLALLLAFLLLPSCSTIQAGVEGKCYAVGSAIGRGTTEVVCSPEIRTYRIDPAPVESAKEEKGQTETPKQKTKVETKEHLDEIHELCKKQGCTVEVISDTHISIKGGPSDKNPVSGFVDMIFSVGSWFATKYFSAAGF